MADFSEWTLQDVQEAVAGAIEEQLGSQEAFDESAAFIEEHDHWQDGDAWVGPNGGTSDEVRTAVLAAVERQFTPRDAVSEVLDRMANALLRQEPGLDITPLEPVLEDASDEARATQEAEIDEIRARLSAWWDAKKLWNLARKAVKRSRWAARGALRTWIAPGHLVTTEAETDDGGKLTSQELPTADSFADAMAMVQLSAPEPDACYVYIDEETQRRCAIFLFEDPETEKEAAELWWLDEKGQTVVRVVGEAGSEEDDASFDLGGRLPIAEMGAELLITEPTRRQQKRLNFAESLLTRVAETGGFPERYTLNAEPGGIWLQTQPAEGPALKTHTDKAGRVWYLHSAPRTLGAAITTDLVGVTMRSGDGETRATPGVVFKEPTDPEYAIKSARHAYRTILEQCKQGHIVEGGTAEASGVAYQQARADYEDDLNTVRGDLEGMVGQVLEVAIAWADAMMGTPTRYLERYRIGVTMRVRSGPVTPAEQQQNNENVKGGTLSPETAMALNGVEDVDAELAKLASSPEAVVSLRTKQIGGVVELAAEGVPLDLAAEIVGVTDPELLAKFKAAEAAKSAGKRQEDAQDDEAEAAAALLAGTAGGA